MDSTSSHIRVRFAPSPTGFLHVGVARTALFNYLVAQKENGKLILRIEDTDTERSKKEYVEDILAGLEWLGITPDETYYQSERKEVYERYLEYLIETGNAYEAEHNEAGTGTVIRFKNPNIKVTFTDVVRGEITFDTTELGDFVIAKDRNTPLYQLAVVVDDHEMGITHVIRGEDLISSTPRQLLIMRAIGASEPVYAHLPLILGPDRSKLSKRHGAVSLSVYKEAGYIPDAFVNFLALLGWSPGTDKEVFPRHELIDTFSLENIQKGGAIFNTEKLDWVNKEHMKQLPLEEVYTIVQARLQSHYTESEVKEKIVQLTPIILERINKWDDIDAMVREGELTYFFKAPEYDPEHLVWKDTSRDRTHAHLKKVNELLSAADFSSVESIKGAIWDYAEQEGRGNVLWPLRYALSGKDKSPDPFTLCYVLGKDEVSRRLERAVSKLE